jgi:serine/threonine protein kinase
VKVLNKKKSTLIENSVDRDEYIKNMVFLEIKILSKFHSPNIVQIYDVLETEHNYYIVQELCECDLQTWLERDHRYTEEKARNLLEQMCTGYMELIRHGVIHRDIKP